VNAQITKLFAVIIVLYAALFGFTSYWTIFDAKSLEENTANRRPLLEEQQIKRGDILASDEKTVIAHSDPKGSGDNRIYVRTYPEGSLYGNPIGYSFVERGRVGTELEHNDDLVGNKTEFLSIFDQLTGNGQEGSTLVTSIDPEAQKIATDELGDQRGAVVAIVPDTGEIRAMVSVPTYDPNQVVNSDQYNALNTDDSSPLFNRATQAGYPPGSTMKVVTAAAALDSGEADPDSTYDGRSPQTFSGVPLSNFANEQFGPDTDLTTALTHSVNTIWAQVGEQLGKDTMLKYMERFGFDQKPLLDYPSFQLATSGVFEGSKLLTADDSIDIARVAIGQERLNVTPLQMAEVAAAVANDGELMEPRLWSKVIDPDGREESLNPERQSRVMSADSANALTSMMEDVVNEGTGGAAALENDQVAGKTGTAEISDGVNQAWFIGFAPADDPQIAVAATVERTSGEGGTVAAPIVKAVMEALINSSQGDGG
jgi:peptidoglycan glycosyltransferase